jgi:hypothetical protein
MHLNGRGRRHIGLGRIWRSALALLAACLVVVGAASAATAHQLASRSVDRHRTGFEIGQLHRNLETGTGKLAVTVPGPGDLFLYGAGLLPILRQPAQAGTVHFPVVLTGRAKRHLLSTGSATVRAKIAFTPQGGAARTKTVRLTLRAALPK